MSEESRSTIIICMLWFIISMLLIDRCNAAEAYNWSQRALVAATVADLATSTLATHRGVAYEANPILASGAKLGFKGNAIAAGTTIGYLYLQSYILKKEPRAKRWLTIGNFGLAAMHGGLAIQLQVRIK